jgi:hypothetical protein
LLPGVFAMTDLLWSRFDRGTYDSDVPAIYAVEK